MAIRTTSTRTTKPGCASSADSYAFQALVQAYFDCRRAKRNTRSAQVFEVNLEHNLLQLHHELLAGTYYPGKSICFAVTRPKLREVWAADFPDRIVHHLAYGHAVHKFHFIADSCACIPGRGTLYAGQRLESKIRSITQNWTVPAWYLKCDLANFFGSIDKNILHAQLQARITDPWWLDLLNTILTHDPRENYEQRGNPADMARVPAHKRMANQPTHLGLPIGNLSSQFFANVLLNDLDQFIKHRLRCQHYIRYVDDFLLLHHSPQQLNAWHAEIEAFLPRLGVALNPKKTIIQPIERGVDFVGHVIKPHRRTMRRRLVRQAVAAVQTAHPSQLMEKANSYFGLLTQAKSHHDRARLAKAVLARGRAVNRELTKTYRGNV